MALSIQDSWESYRTKFADAAKVAGFDEQYIKDCLQYARSLFEKNVPVIYDGLHFSSLVGYDPEYIFGVSNSAIHYYRKFNIQKKNGKIREISEPLPSLKSIQRWILENILDKIAVHSAAKAYICGKSIKDNARFHRKQPAVVRIDVKDFFPSIGVGAVYMIFARLGYSPAVSKMLARICTLQGSLPQGAPTSAALSNIFFYPIDSRLYGFARANGIRYTRYADDLTFSGEININQLCLYVENVLSEHKLQINTNKTAIMRKGQRQIVTGIVVNSTMKCTREFRRELRKEMHFIEKYGVESHVSRMGISRSNYVDHMIGKAAYILSIDRKDKHAKEYLSILYGIKKKYEHYNSSY